MIFGIDKAKVGNCLLGEMFYAVELNGKIYKLHDTVGLGEHSSGTVDSVKVVRNLYRLLNNLSNSRGINLLVFIMKQGRLTETIYKNFVLFQDSFCNSKVPIVIIVTGCKDIEPMMDRWWINNEASFLKAGISFDGYACVCAFKGRKINTSGYHNEDLVHESIGVVKQLVIQYCMPNGWKKVCPSSIMKLAFGIY